MYKLPVNWLQYANRKQSQILILLLLLGNAISNKIKNAI